MQNEIELKDEGEVICSKCDGTGYIGKKSLETNSFEHICPKCNGYKKLTWTEHVIGKKKISYSGISGITGTDGYSGYIGVSGSTGCFGYSGYIGITKYIENESSIEKNPYVMITKIGK